MNDKAGVIVFFLNYNPEIEGVTFEEQIRMFKELNKEFIEFINGSTKYRVAIVPTTKEACRVEKIDFDSPFPRFVPNHADIKETEQNKILVRQIMEKRYRKDDDE